MKATFIETSGFTEAITNLLPDFAYAQLQLMLMRDPELGDVMPGCGGLRKIRVADPKRQEALATYERWLRENNSWQQDPESPSSSD